jgi:hypothetical protein
VTARNATLRGLALLLAAALVAFVATEYVMAARSRTPIVVDVAVPVSCEHGCLGPAPLAPPGHPAYVAQHRAHHAPALPRTGR